MGRRRLRHIQTAIRNGAFDMTAHAALEMHEDDLRLIDIEIAVLSGELIRSYKDDPRGPRYAVHGIAADGCTMVGVVGRFVGTGRFLIITVFRVTER